MLKNSNINIIFCHNRDCKSYHFKALPAFLCKAQANWSKVHCNESRPGLLHSEEAAISALVHLKKKILQLSAALDEEEGEKTNQVDVRAYSQITSQIKSYT